MGTAIQRDLYNVSIQEIFNLEDCGNYFDFKFRHGLKFLPIKVPFHLLVLNAYYRVRNTRTLQFNSRMLLTWPGISHHAVLCNFNALHAIYNPAQGFDAFLEWCVEVVGAKEDRARGHFQHTGLTINKI